jgi:hypothetical protein
MSEKSNKFIVVLICVVVTAVLLGWGIGILLLGDKKDNKKTGDTPVDEKEKVNIVLSETKKLEYETYNNGLVSFQIPKGWKVEVAPFDYIHYSFKAYNPENPNYMFVFAMKFEGFNKSQVARNWQKKYYPNQLFAKLPVINPQTTEGYYKVWNEIATYVNKYDAKSNYLPKFNNFKVIENLGTNKYIGGDILRATFTDSSNKKMQGIFTSSVKSAGTYYVNSNVFDLTSKKIDVWPLIVYNTIFMTAPDEEFNNWQSIYDKCIGSIEFSQTFVNGFNKEESSILKTIQANQKIYNETSDMIMDSWNKRNASYDITSQKQSDATLGYERVYDTETGDVYKAYNGFTDDYQGERYKPITDDMYTNTISGYIEK